MEIQIEGLRELRADLTQVKKTAGKASTKGLQSVGLEIVAEAKMNIKHNKTYDTGTLSASGRVQKDKDGVDAGFFANDSGEGYAASVEYGRGPSKKKGEISLRTTLRAWVHRKLGIPEGKELDTVTFLIARKIHRKGTKPQPFFAPAVKKLEDKISDIVGKFIDEAIG